MTSLASPTIGHVGDADLADLGRVDVDVHDLGVRREVSAALPVTRSSKRAPSATMQVGLLQREHRGHRAVHAGHAEVLRVRVGERAARHQRRDDRSAGRLGELEQLLATRATRMTPPPT